MEKERSFATRALSIIGFGLLAFAITVLAGSIYGAGSFGFSAADQREQLRCTHICSILQKKLNEENFSCFHRDNQEKRGANNER
jgi:hypothetical protein